MTTLVTEELKTTLTQSITLNQHRIYHFNAVKIKLLMYNEPAGTFKLSIKDGPTTLAEKEFTSADIKADLDTSDPYAYLYKVVEFGHTPLKTGTYDFVLSATGYTFSDSSFLGWIKSHENIFNTRGEDFLNVLSNPLDILIYENKREDLIA